MKSLKKFAIYFTVYMLMFAAGEMAALANNVWYMIFAILTVSLGCSLIEYYAKNYDKFN